MGKKQLPHRFYVENAVRSVEELPTGDLLIRVKGIPFNGPISGRDLHGEFFTEETDIGPLQEVLSYFHHGRDPDYGNGLLGKARLVGPDQSGWFYDIIVDKNAKYRDAIRRLAEEGYLGASSSAYPNSVEVDETGKIKKWHVVEMSLTWSPANPDAVVAFRKALEQGGIMPEEIQVEAAEEQAEGQNEAPQEAEATLIERIENALPKADNVSERGSETVFDALAARLDAQEALIIELRETFEKGLKEIAEAMPYMAKALGEYVEKSLKVRVAEEQRMSFPEIEVRRAVRQKAANNNTGAGLPVHAPGKNN